MTLRHIYKIIFYIKKKNNITQNNITQNNITQNNITQSNIIVIQVNIDYLIQGFV